MFRVIPPNTSRPMLPTMLIIAALAAFVAVDAGSNSTD